MYKAVMAQMSLKKVNLTGHTMEYTNIASTYLYSLESAEILKLNHTILVAELW